MVEWLSNVKTSEIQTKWLKWAEKSCMKLSRIVPQRLQRQRLIEKKGVATNVIDFDKFPMKTKTQSFWIMLAFEWCSISQQILCWTMAVWEKRLCHCFCIHWTIELNLFALEESNKIIRHGILKKFIQSRFDALLRICLGWVVQCSFATANQSISIFFIGLPLPTDDNFITFFV